jgi:hypothetical protein
MLAWDQPSPREVAATLDLSFAVARTCARLELREQSRRGVPLRGV